MIYFATALFDTITTKVKNVVMLNMLVDFKEKNKTKKKLACNSQGT